MGDYDMCKLCFGEIVAWKSHACAAQKVDKNIMPANESYKVKIKVDGKGVYLKEEDWDAYKDGKATATGRAIPNYKRLDKECKASPTEYFKFICQEEHSTFH